MRTLRFRDVSEEATFDLNLAPMMDMLVSIIPFMLLSATFMQIMLINVPLPAPVARALAEDRNKPNEVSIKVGINAQSGFDIVATDENGRSQHFTVPKVKNDFDFTALHNRLVAVKQQYPKIFHLNLNPDKGIQYESIVKTMDASRDMSKDDPKVLIENTATPLLFPDVILANVME